MTPSSKRQWIVSTERVTVTLVSEPAPMPQMIGGGPLPADFKPPMFPAYLLVSRPGGGEPIRIEGEDAELLMWMLLKLGVGSFQQQVGAFRG